MHYRKLTLLLLIFFTISLWAKSDSTAISLQINSNGFLTEERIHLFNSDYFPFLLGERGRIATSGYRGMPAGFYEYAFDHQPLINPLTGFWDSQWLPQQRIGKRLNTSVFPTIELASNPFPKKRPVTDITFHQDYVTSLSYLDIDFQMPLPGKRFIELSGNNFLREGTLGSQRSRIHVNTYQTHFRTPVRQKMTLDVYFWQIRHKFNLPPQNFFSFSKDKFKSVLNLAWLKLQVPLSEKDTLYFQPTYSYLTDNYWNEGNLLRSIGLRQLGSDISLVRRINTTRLTFRINGDFYQQYGKWMWKNKKETNVKGSVFFQQDWQSLSVSAETGILTHSELGRSAEAGVRIDYRKSNETSFTFNVFQKSQPTPLLWRTLRGDSIPPLTTKQFIRKRGISFRISQQLTTGLAFQLEPFYYQALDFPVYSENQRTWQLQDFKNSGIQINANLKWWRFLFQNQFTYNQNFKRVFAPSVSDVFSGQTHLELFNRALRVEGTLFVRLFGNYQLLEFNRLLYQYGLQAEAGNPFSVTDAIVRAYIKDAILFFSFENILSTDYQVVSGFPEFYRFFRFGVYWRLFD